MNYVFEKAFKKAVKKYANIQKIIKRKVLQIIEHPIELGEPLKGDLRGFYSCPVKRSYIIIYLYCELCRKKGDDKHIACSDCSETQNDTIKFVGFGRHDYVYALKFNLI